MLSLILDYSLQRRAYCIFWLFARSTTACWRHRSSYCLKYESSRSRRSCLGEMRYWLSKLSVGCLSEKISVWLLRNWLTMLTLLLFSSMVLLRSFRVAGLSIWKPFCSYFGRTVFGELGGITTIEGSCMNDLWGECMLLAWMANFDGLTVLPSGLVRLCIPWNKHKYQILFNFLSFSLTALSKTSGILDV